MILSQDTDEETKPQRIPEVKLPDGEVLVIGSEPQPKFKIHHLSNNLHNCILYYHKIHSIEEK